MLSLHRERKRISSVIRRLFQVRNASTLDYTSVHYNVTQRHDLNNVTEEDINYFSNLLDGRVVTDEHDLEAHNIDWLNMLRGQSRIMVKPKTTQEVSLILKYCNERKIAVCPQGGNTGLVGGSVPVFDEVILNTQLLNKINQIDAAGGYAVCGAGVVLEHLDNTLADNGLMVPLDLGAKGSCHIGGNVSTNAGGLRYLRYGSLHGSVLGVEVVLADGTILDLLSTLRKDNTGYDLKQLFIGSEGTLGMVTAVSISTPQRPSSVNLCMIGVNSYEDVQKIFLCAKSMLGEILSAFEFEDQQSMETVETNLGYRSPIGQFPFYVIVETSGSNANHDTEKLDEFLEKVMGDGVALDGTMASEPSKMKEIWKLRESIAQGLLGDGEGRYKYDISVPVKAMYEIVPLLRERLADRTTRVCGYGHYGDGNIHVNVVSRYNDDEVLNLIEPYIFEWTAKHQGSVSAEHGLGFKKANMMHYSKQPEAIAIMKRMKHLFDPNGILNPYKMLPTSS